MFKEHIYGVNLKQTAKKAAVYGLACIITLTAVRPAFAGGMVSTDPLKYFFPSGTPKDSYPQCGGGIPGTNIFGRQEQIPANETSVIENEKGIWRVTRIGKRPNECGNPGNISTETYCPNASFGLVTTRTPEAQVRMLVCVLGN